MIEIKGDLWDYHKKGYWVVITTNGILDSKGCLVMGAGTALQAKERYPELPCFLGKLVAKAGNQMYLRDDLGLIFMPVKHHWKDKADLELIKQNCQVLADLAKLPSFFETHPKLVMPRPGCGAGGLTWHEVKRVIGDAVESMGDKVAIIEWK